MKKILNKALNLDNYRKLINPHIEPLQKAKLKNKKKITEICQTGKFLLVLDDQLLISEAREKPDFLISTSTELIGLEHQVIVDSKAKEREGFFEGIFDQAEAKLQLDSDLPNFLANCYLKPHVNFKINQKSNLVDIIYNVVREYVLTDILAENPMIDSIWKMPHSQIGVNVNLGAWWQKSITPELIKKAIRSTEEKLTIYKKNTVFKQWLLLVIGGVGESSYDVEKLEKFEIKSDFDRIYIMEDFNASVYQIK